MARPKTKPFKADAAFNPAGYAICPVCWSRPDIDEAYLKRKREAGKLSGRGWGIIMGDEVLEHLGVKTSVITTKYPCSRIGCLVHILVHSLNAFVGTRDAYTPWREKHQLTGSDAEKYLTGHTDRKGVWHADAAPEPVAAPVHTTPPKRGRPKAVPLPEKKATSEKPKRTRAAASETTSRKEKVATRTSAEPVAEKPVTMAKAAPKTTKRKKASKP